MFLRFVTTRIHDDSHKGQGVFAAAYALLDSGNLTRDETQYLSDLLNCFNANLPQPPKTFNAKRAIFWFKSTSGESIRKIWELVYLLRQHEYHIEIQKCRRLGNIPWEDKFQVAAFPSKLDAKITVQ